MRILLLIVLIFSTHTLFSQAVTVYGTVKSSEGEIIKYVSVVYGMGEADFTKTDRDGKYRFKINIEEIEKLVFSELNHETKTILLTRRLLKGIENNRLELNVVLNDIVLKEIIVEAKAPLEFFGTQAYSVSDFEIDAHSNFILLTYPKTMNKGSSLQLLDANQQVIDTYELTGNAVELSTDFRKQVHLITKKKIYLIQVVDQKIKLYEEDRDYYFTYVSPILDTLNQNIYYSNFSEIYPAFSYIQFNRIDSTYQPLLGIIDEDMMEQYLAEFKFSDVRTKLWAHQKQIETGIDKEVWVGATIFTNSIYYQPLYAPLFVKKDTVYIFDHYKNKLFKYDDQGVAQDSIKIAYHLLERKSGWKRPLIQDRITQSIYIIFERNGFTYLSFKKTFLYIC